MTLWSGLDDGPKGSWRSGTTALANTDPIHIGIDAVDAHPDLVDPPALHKHYTWSLYVDCKNLLPEGKAPGIHNNLNEVIKRMPDSFHEGIH